MIAAAPQAVTRTAFATTSCSQCGRSFGPGLAGFSACVQHMALIKPVASPVKYPTISFHSSVLGAKVECSYDIEDADCDESGSWPAEAILMDVLCGGVEWSQHLTSSTLNVLQFELTAALKFRAGEHTEFHADVLATNWSAG